MMNINLHIERLILDGLPVDQRQGPVLQAAVERELARLLSVSGSTALFSTGGTLASVKGESIQGVDGASPGRLGNQIASAVYGGLGGRP